MNKKIMCGACGQTHSSVEEVRLCHGTKDVFVEDNQVEIKRSKRHTVVKTTKKEEPKTYVVREFLTKESAEAFAAKTPNARIGTTRVKYVNGVADKTYQVIVSLK